MLGVTYDVLPSLETCPLCSSAALLWHNLSANKTSLSKEPYATRPAAAIKRECLEINYSKTGLCLWGSWNAGTLFSPLSGLGQIRQRTTYCMGPLMIRQNFSNALTHPHPSLVKIVGRHQLLFKPVSKRERRGAISGLVFVLNKFIQLM